MKMFKIQDKLIYPIQPFSPYFSDGGGGRGAIKGKLWRYNPPLPPPPENDSACCVFERTNKADQKVK